MKTSWSFVALALAGVLAANAADVVIQSFDTGGTLTFNEVSNATGYRVEWAPAFTEMPWSTSAPPGVAAVPATGSGTRTVTVSVQQVSSLYRVVATVSNPPPPGMVLIPVGTFVMGSCTNVGQESYVEDVPQHTVYVSAFYMDQYEVTKALWDEVKAYSATNGYGFSNAGSGKATNHPVHTVNWFDAMKWCNARSQEEGLTPVYYTDAGFGTVYRTGEETPYPNWAADGYRLPTEAEWEKAARGGVADTRFPWSDSNTIQHARANYFSTVGYGFDTSPTREWHPSYRTGSTPYSSPVGSFAPNDYGLYDVAGNVYEWCWDWWEDTYYGSSPLSDPRGPVSGVYRMMRGGSWNDPAKYVRCADRMHNNPVNESNDMGFRCARGL